MLFSIKRPKSQRFFKISFDGFEQDGKNKVHKFILKVISFVKAINKYFVKRAKSSILLFKKLSLNTVGVSKNTKAFITKKLIWSRGKLGRPIATFVVMSFAFLIFLFGEVLNSSKFVVSQELNPDYLSNVTDIIPQKNTAITTIPESRKNNESFTYAVEPGDTLSAIGNKFRISVDAIKYVNNITSDYLKVGQEIVIPPVSGLIHEVEDGDSLASIADKYDVPSQAIADFNYILDTSKLAVGTELVIPGAKVPEVPVPVVSPSIPSSYTAFSPAAPTPSSSYCVWPSSTRIITQYFSWYHNGLDIATPWGSAMPPLFACTSGTVTRAGWDPWGLGLHVKINHGNGYETVYGHMSRVDVGYGQSVGRGQVIGYMGNTGRSTGPHVHFTVNYNGVAQNPLSYTN